MVKKHQSIEIAMLTTTQTKATTVSYLWMLNNSRTSWPTLCIRITATTTKTDTSHLQPLARNRENELEGRQSYKTVLNFLLQGKTYWTFSKSPPSAQIAKPWGTSFIQTSTLPMDAQWGTLSLVLGLSFNKCMACRQAFSHPRGGTFCI